MAATTDHTWQVTLHHSESEQAYLGTLFVGSPEDAFQFALGLRPQNREVWIRVEHIPCLIIVQ